MEERYSRNIPAVSEEDQNKLKQSSVLVAGCGGLGGFIVEYLARMGIGAITAVDGDVFCESNLNRQLLSRIDNLGKKKALAVADRVREINPDVRVQAVPEFLTEENAVGLMEGTDIVMDALDNVDSRYILEDAAAEAGLTIVHGAICGWDLQVMLIPPGSGMIHRLYPAGSQAASKTSLAITPAVCAAFQASMAVRYLCGCASDSDRDLFVGSLRDLSFEAVHLRD
ncbi:MAG: HesA/MoeB/ThiF family protein [Blautia sp.]|nr:HesA/MoeB/ThiF family protein [Blautia sp.]